jgi:DNA-binding GntR family transcriptional regulator
MSPSAGTYAPWGLCGQMGRHRDAIVDGLRDLLLAGKIESGTIFSENEIAARFGVSRTPAREAVAILAQEGLVDQIPQVGVTVHAFSQEEIDELLSTRQILETQIAARLANRPPAAEDISELRRIHGEMEQAAKDGDKQGFLEADARFHMEIAHRARYFLAAELLKGISDKIRIVGLTAIKREDGMEEVLDEHRAVLEAIAVHDGEKASTAMDEHLEATGRRLARTRLESN